MTSFRPTRPPIGADTRVNSTSSRAASTAACASSTDASACRTFDSRMSDSSCEMAWLFSRSAARAKFFRASASRDFASSRSASVRCSAASYGRGSIKKRRSPFWTIAPSWKWIDCRYPLTRGRTSTESTASRGRPSPLEAEVPGPAVRRTKRGRARRPGVPTSTWSGHPSGSRPCHSAGEPVHGACGRRRLDASLTIAGWQHRRALVADEKIVHVGGALFLLREDPLEQHARSRVPCHTPRPLMCSLLCRPWSSDRYWRTRPKARARP